MAGTIIPAALVTGLNSDFPGEIIATVTQNVYDTVTGRYLLLPLGTRLLGQYDSQVTYDQRRVLLVWTRLLMPDGSSMVHERLPGVDMAGYFGVEDGVNWHWGQIFVGAVLTTLLGVNAQLVAANTNTNSGSIVIATRQSAQDSANQVGQKITRENLSERSLEITRAQLVRLEAKAMELETMISYVRAKIAWLKRGRKGRRPDFGSYMRRGSRINVEQTDGAVEGTVNQSSIAQVEEGWGRDNNE
jgi:hypothetical protein